MARNEEKQLGRLNRLYLQQQKEEELRKRPPRPKLETLTTREEISKWLPTIMRDMDFNIKQMEVPCFPNSKIEEFEQKINSLRGEYKSFIRKLHQLEPDLKTTPWTERPYAVRQKRFKPSSFTDQSLTNTSTETTECSPQEETQDKSQPLTGFMPLSTPVLEHDHQCLRWYGFDRPPEHPIREEDRDEVQNQPLEFSFTADPRGRTTHKHSLCYQKDAVEGHSRTDGCQTYDSTEVCCSHSLDRHTLSTPGAFSSKNKFSQDEASEVNLDSRVTVSRTLHVPYTDSSSSDSDV